MNCSVAHCDKEAEYKDTIAGHCGNTDEYEIFLCKEHYLNTYCHNEEQEEEILEEAKRI